MHRTIAVLAALFTAICPSLAAQNTAKMPVKVLSPHWVSVEFSPQFPYARHTQNPLSSNGLHLPIPESAYPHGQAGQPSDVRLDFAEYRVSIPDFAADAAVDRVIVLADISGDAVLPTLDGVPSTAAKCPADACAHLGLSPAALAHLRAFDIASPHAVDSAEYSLIFRIAAGQSLDLYDESGPAHFAPVLLLHTRNAVARRVGWSSPQMSGLDMPTVAPLFDQFLRDASIVNAPDGFYYMTGTTGGPEAWVVTSDLSVWKSPDLAHWSPVMDAPRPSTVVWNLDRDGTWMKPVTLRDGEPFRPLWAPEIHYFQNTFWIPFSVPRHGITILKSATGKAAGPYAIALSPDEPLSTGIDASLFVDDDGSVYALYGGGYIARMKPDMTGLAEPFHRILSASGREIGFEGVFLFKNHGIYTLTAADFVNGEYNTYAATATSLAGPWSERYLAVPHVGHGNFFRDKQGRMWSTYFGNDRNTPFLAKPAIVPMLLDAKGRWRPDAAYKFTPAPAAADASSGTPGAAAPALASPPQQVGIMPASK